MKPFEILKKRILQDTGELLTNFKSKRIVEWQRKAGMWSWIAQKEGCPWDFGSQYTVGELLKKKDPLEIIKTSFGFEII